ncbi:MAG: hypothetical protein QOG62_1517 [Thermoleophilaceae bacterium]|nr:hypothetical protein [Thermoleophilaceae bacterium]
MATQQAVAGGAGYKAPTAGVLTSWSTSAVATVGLSVLHPALNDPTTLTRVADAPALANTDLTPHPVRIPIALGDLIGLRTETTGQYPGCAAATGDVGDQALTFQPVPATGAPFLYTPTPTARISISAVLEPDFNADGFGDESQNVIFDNGPKRKSKKKTGVFTFHGPAEFECSVDKKAFKRCTSPFKAKKLKPRKHKFRVHAVLGTGEIAPDVVWTWRVVKG